METETPIRQCITLLDKKVRNLEKRKAKLDSLRDKAGSGDPLDKDQQDAVSKYEVVIQNLDFSRELQKQFQQISNDADKQIKKQIKREKIERQQQEVSRLQVVLKLQSILDSLGTEEIRKDFKTGTGSKVVLTDDDLTHLDEFYQAIVPSRMQTTNFEEQLSASAEHISLFLDSSDKIFAPVTSDSSEPKRGTTITYEQLNRLIESIHTSGYFEKNVNEVGEEQMEQIVAAAESKAPLEEENFVKETHHQAEVILDEPTMHQWEQAPTYAPNGPQEYEETTETYNNNTDLYTNQDRVFVNQANVYASEVYSNAYTSQAAAVYTNSYRQRPLQEIVSSMQGNYNFLQDSEIDVDGNHINQIIPNTSHYGAPNTNNYMHIGQVYPNTSVGMPNLPVSSYPTSVGAANMPVSELQYLEGHRHYSGSPAYVQMVVGPPPIPLPNEDSQTSADETLFIAKDSRQTEAKAEVNVPNVSMFQEEEKIVGKQGAGDIGPRTFAQTAGGVIQNYGGVMRGQATGPPRPNIQSHGQNKNMSNMHRGPPKNNGDGRGYSGSGHSNQRPSNSRGQEPSRGYSRSNQMQATA